MAVVYITKIEGGEKVTEGLCIKCAKELGLPVDNMLGGVLDKFGLSPDQVESMENDVNEMLAEGLGGVPSDNDDSEDGGAPAIDFPKLIRESGLFGGEAPNVDGISRLNNEKGESPEGAKKSASKKENSKGEKKYKFLTTYCRNLTEIGRAHV